MDAELGATCKECKQETDDLEGQMRIEDFPEVMPQCIQITKRGKECFGDPRFEENKRRECNGKKTCCESEFGYRYIS